MNNKIKLKSICSVKVLHIMIVILILMFIDIVTVYGETVISTINGSGNYGDSEDTIVIVIDEPAIHIDGDSLLVTFNSNADINVLTGHSIDRIVGVWVRNGAELDFKKDMKLNFTSEGIGIVAGVFPINNARISFDGNVDLNVKSPNENNTQTSRAISLEDYSTISFTDLDAHISFSISNAGLGSTFGIFTWNGSSMTVAGKAVDINVENTNKNNGSSIIGIETRSSSLPSSISFTNPDGIVNINVVGTTAYSDTMGVYALESSKINFAGSIGVKVSNINENSSGSIYGLCAMLAESEISVAGAVKINVNKAGNGGGFISGITAYDSAGISLSDVTLGVTNSGKGAAYGIMTDGDNSSITFTGNADLTVTATNTASTDSIMGIGVWGAGSTVSFTNHLSTVVLNVFGAGKASAYGVLSDSKSSALFAGDTTITVIHPEDYSFDDFSLYSSGGTISVNASKTKITKITGSVASESAGNIIVNFTNNDSFLRGLLTEKTDGKINMLLSDGAVWQPIGDADSLNQAHLTLDKGIVDIAWWHNRLGVYNPTNSFRTIALNATPVKVTDNGFTLIVNTDVQNNEADKLAIEKLAADNVNRFDVNVSVAYDPVVSTLKDKSVLLHSSTEIPVFIIQDVNGVNPVIKPIGGTTVIDDVLYKYTIKPYAALSAQDPYTVVITDLEVITEPSTPTEVINSMTIPLIWLMRNDTLLKRMGDLRNDSGNAVNGVWARVYNQYLDMKSDADEKIISNTNYYEVGFDKVITGDGDKLVYGVVFNYLSAKNDFASGSGRADNVGAGLYGTFINGNGQYLDIVAKAGTLRGSFAVLDGNDNTVKAKYNTWLGTFSAEYGLRASFDHGYSIEPQAQIMLGRINGCSYKLDNGLNADYDAMYSFVGRIGFVGYQKFKRDEIFLGCSVLHDFAKSTTVTAGYEDNEIVFRPSVARTYFNVNAGANVKLSANGYGYLEFSRMFGSKIGNNYKINAGARYSF